MVTFWTFSLPDFLEAFGWRRSGTHIIKKSQGENYFGSSLFLVVKGMSNGEARMSNDEKMTKLE